MINSVWLCVCVLWMGECNNYCRQCIATAQRLAGGRWIPGGKMNRFVLFTSQVNELFIYVWLKWKIVCNSLIPRFRWCSASGPKESTKIQNAPVLSNAEISFANNNVRDRNSSVIFLLLFTCKRSENNKNRCAEMELNACTRLSVAIG